MKKLIAVIIVVMVLLIGFEVYVTWGSYPTAEEAVAAATGTEPQIIHQTALKHGHLVLSQSSEENGIVSTALRKTLMGYKVVYSGYQGDADTFLEMWGTTVAEFPSLRGVSDRIVFGFADSERIERIEIVTSENSAAKAAEFETMDSKYLGRTCSFWIAEIDGDLEDSFDVMAYDANGELVEKISE